VVRARRHFVVVAWRRDVWLVILGPRLLRPRISRTGVLKRSCRHAPVTYNRYATMAGPRTALRKRIMLSG
jgi:hypothetical protein